MSAAGVPVRRALVVAILALLPAAASAQLKDAQDKGWSVLKDGYGLIASMCDNKSNRTRANFDTVLSKISTSMADMSPYIDKMGERVADEDKSYAAGLRDNIRSAWKSVGDAHEKARRAYDAAKDAPEKLAEISEELDSLKSALEKYETACKAAYLNYKARWDEIRSAMEKMDGDFKSAREKVDNLDKQHDALVKEDKSLAAEVDKVYDDHRKIDKLTDDLMVSKDAMKEKMSKAFSDGNVDDYKRYRDNYLNLRELNHQLIVRRIATYKKMEKLDVELERNEEQRDKLELDIESALDQMEKLTPLKMLQRYSQWDAEFPAKNYSFQSLK